MKMMKKNIGKSVYDVRPVAPSDGERVCLLYGECGRPAVVLVDGHDKGKRHFLCQVHLDTEWVEVQAS